MSGQVEAVDVQRSRSLGYSQRSEAPTAACPTLRNPLCKPGVELHEVGKDLSPAFPRHEGPTSRLWVSGFHFRVWGLGFRVWSLGLRV